MPVCHQSITKRGSSLRHYISVLAKAGYIAKGVTYLLIAYTVLRAAGYSGRAGTTRRAMGTLDNGSLSSELVLLAIAAGLGGYALWKLYIAAMNPENDGIPKRFGSLFIAGINAGLAVQAFLLAVTRSPGSGHDQAIHWTTIVMRYPLGITAVGITGVCVAGYGLRQIYRGVTADLDDRLFLGQMDTRPRKIVVIIARVGVASRGFVFALIGTFLTRAALRANPSEARDFGDSLQELRKHPNGHIALYVIAVGLSGYALYEFIRARYRSIPVHK